MSKPVKTDLSLGLYTPLWLVIVVTSIYTAANLAPGTELPIHWDINFEPDNYANKWFALLMLPGVAALVALLFLVIPMIEPRRDNMKLSGDALKHIFWAVQIFLCDLQFFLISYAWEWHWSMAKFMAFGLGLLFLMIGNVLSKTRSTYSLGIRTPWTLSNERVWRIVHRGAGWQLFIVGTVLLLSTPWAGRNTLIVALAAMFAVFAWATLYSFLLWQKQENSTSAIDQDDCVNSNEATGKD